MRPRTESRRPVPVSVAARRHPLVRAVRAPGGGTTIRLDVAQESAYLSVSEALSLLGDLEKLLVPLGFLPPREDPQ